MMKNTGREVEQLNEWIKKANRDKLQFEFVKKGLIMMNRCMRMEMESFEKASSWNEKESNIVLGVVIEALLCVVGCKDQNEGTFEFYYKIEDVVLLNDVLVELEDNLLQIVSSHDCFRYVSN